MSRGVRRARRIRSLAVSVVKRFGGKAKQSWQDRNRLHIGSSSQAATNITPRGRRRRLRLTVDSPEWLECYANSLAAGQRIHHLDLVVHRWRRPQPGWSGQLGPLPNLISSSVTLPASDSGGTVRVQLHVGRAVPAQQALMAIARILRPEHRLPYPVTADVVSLASEIPWLTGTAARSELKLVSNPTVRAYDTVVTDTDLVVPPEDISHVVRSGPGGLDLRDRAPWPVLNLMLSHPHERGRKCGPHAGAGLLELDEKAWQVRLEGKVVTGGRFDVWPFVPGNRAALRQVGVVRGDVPDAVEPGSLALLLVHLAATGVVLDLPQLPRTLNDRLGPQLQALLQTPLPAVDADPLEWEIRSVRQRTTAIREHAACFVMRDKVMGDFSGLSGPPSVSVIVVTRRAEYLANILAMIEQQSYPNLEVIIGLHGTDLPAELRNRVRQSLLPTEIVTASGHLSFGEALGAATARARGSLITKIDDDDWYGPEHVWDLVVARAFSGATMVGKAAEFVYVEPLAATLRRETLLPEVYGDPVAGGTMLIGRGELEEIGGWRPVPRSVDRGLLDRLLHAGGTIYRTHPLGYLYERRSIGHTWDMDLEYFLRGVRVQWPGRLALSEFGTEHCSARMAHSS